MQILNQIQTDFKDYLATNSFDQEPNELYAPINYILNIGGKRLRPAILLLSCYLFDGRYKQAMPAALAIETFHNFTLVHDDIMDEAPLRRGKTTVHHKYDVNTGILSGDVMMVHAFNYLLQMDQPEKMTKILKSFTKQAIEVCEGQQMDMNFESREDVSIDEYLKMIELKTSVLVAAAMEIGAIMGGASEADATAIYQFGRHLGIAFQIQDDILDTYGDPKKFGKKVGGDIAQNKKTVLYLTGLQLAETADRLALQDLYQSTADDETKKIREVMAIFDRLGVRESTEKLQEAYKNKAFAYLDGLEVPENRKQEMLQFGYSLINREV